MKEDSDQRRMDVYVDKFRRYLQKDPSLPKEVIEAFVNVGKPVKYKKGEIFAKQGDLSNKMAYVCSGIFNLFSTQEDGSLFVVKFMKEDDFIQGSFDISAPCNITTQAICDSVVIEFQCNVIQELYLKYSQLGYFALRILGKYFVIYAAHMIQIGTRKALDNYMLFRKDFHGYEDRIPQHLIAGYLGITPTQLSRIRKKISDTQQANQAISS